MRHAVGVARVEHYRFGHVVVDGQEETRDVIVLPHRVVRNWWRADGHALVVEDLKDVWGELPEQLIIGTGASGQMRPDPGTVELLGKKGMNVYVLKTEDAVRRYQELDPATTAIALHLTC